MPATSSSRSGSPISCECTRHHRWSHPWLMLPDSMKRVEQNGTWSLFCPNEAPGMADVWGDEFEALYEKYEKEGRARKTIEAQKLWYAILEAQIETGGPFMLYKDAANSEYIAPFCERFSQPLQGSRTSKTLAR